MPQSLADRPRTQPFSTTYVVTALVLLAAVLRAAGLFDGFWLDEIWSWDTARQLTSPLQILTTPLAQIDNNHPLNTLLIYLMGDQRLGLVYRLPALLAGIGSVALAGLILKRRGQADAVFGTCLIGFSFPLILYSSEARGYGLMVFFLLLAGGLFRLWQARSDRGAYLDGVRYMARQTPGPVIRLTSDNDFRTQMLLSFYKRYLPEDQHLEYQSFSSPSIPPPQWLIRNILQIGVRPVPPLDDGRGNHYIFREEFPYYGPSGWSWYLYQRAEASTRSWP